MELWNYNEIRLVRNKKGFLKETFQSKCHFCGNMFSSYLKNLLKKGLVCRKCSISLTKKKIEVAPEETNWKDSTPEHLLELQNLQNKWEQRTKEESQKINKKRKQTCLQKYGVDSVMKVETFKDKVFEQILDENGKLKEDIKEKIKETNREKSGFDWPLSNPETRKKSIEFFRKNFNCENSMQVADFKEKARETCLSHYGVEKPAQSQEVQERMKQTCLERYGVSNYAQTKECKEKIKETCLEKYGVPTNLLIPGINHPKNPKLLKDGVQFDSSWEMKYYEYCKNNNLEIEREPVRLSFEFDGKEYFYIPDFRVNGELIEIKGDFFLDENQNLIDPFHTDSDFLQRKAKAKQKCMDANNVKMLTKKDLKELGIPL